MRPSSLISSIMAAMLLMMLDSGMHAARSEPIVLFDSGQTSSIAPFMQAFRPKQAPSANARSAPQITPSGYGLPVETPSMTPGRVVARSLPTLHGKMAGARPLFLVGADQWSLQWLRQNRATLAELGAVGMVISVAREGDLNILRREAGSLPLMVASAEALATELKLSHYPLLITPPGVVQQ